MNRPDIKEYVFRGQYTYIVPFFMDMVYLPNQGAYIRPEIFNIAISRHNGLVEHYTAYTCVLDILKDGKTDIWPENIEKTVYISHDSTSKEVMYTDIHPLHTLAITNDSQLFMFPVSTSFDVCTSDETREKIASEQALFCVDFANQYKAEKLESDIEKFRADCKEDKNS